VRGRPLYVFHKNLMDHIGAMSSFTVRAHRDPFPRCFEPMSAVWSLQVLERYKVRSLPSTLANPSRKIQGNVLGHWDIPPLLFCTCNGSFFQATSFPLHSTDSLPAVWLDAFVAQNRAPPCMPAA
jgi:hypothetical protein